MFRHIAVPVDLGHLDRLDHALEVAADLAKHYGATVTYFGVTTPQPGTGGHNPEEFARHMTEFAQSQADSRGVADASGEMVLSHDPSVDLENKLVEAIETSGADLVVMGSHVPRRFDLPSHGGRIAGHSHISVMLVRDKT